MKKKLLINGKNTFVISETLLNVLSEINLIDNENMAIAVNEQVVQKNNWKNYKIRSGDTIEIVKPLKGG
ncbi:MAG: hypothetical protein CFH26_00456 [Alphaproteobacteria bacterium MarineAlpha6_Bin4]|nr:MAG: hypothetical protein CFH25_00091 [Alphaproteobacteria bacterium MarineAlpha6_Bin3]PPR37899.1 MAG: hypothetical protein CFH26_00456 [Alphaproteobacteria bacterium MarineAlpha6_Bin4]|tara:strand:- start:4889 stop:5095 length:207 start_codon:yes stop_codon:yes gene_type:complete